MLLARRARRQLPRRQRRVRARGPSRRPNSRAEHMQQDRRDRGTQTPVIIVGSLDTMLEIAGAPDREVREDSRGDEASRDSFRARVMANISRVTRARDVANSSRVVDNTDMDRGVDTSSSTRGGSSRNNNHYSSSISSARSRVSSRGSRHQLRCKGQTVRCTLFMRCNM